MNSLEQAFSEAGYEAPETSASWTMEQLDELARRIQPPKDVSLTEQWTAELIARVAGLCAMFSDDRGDEKIIANKLADHVTHFFGRERDKITKAAQDAQAEITALYDRGTVYDGDGNAAAASEVNEGRIEQLRDRISMLREQYSVANIAFVACRDQARHKVFDETGIRWDRSYRDHEMHTLVTQIAKLRRKLTSDLLESHRPQYMGIQHELIQKEKRLKAIKERERRRDALHTILPRDDSAPVFDQTAAGARNSNYDA